MARSGLTGWATAAVLAVAATARATGSLETDGATKLAVGAAPHPGFSIVDPYSQTGTPPSLGTVAPPSPFGAPLAGPPAYDVGGGAGVLNYTTSQTLPGGSYDCATFGVAKFMTVTFTGPTTIRCTANFLCQGSVRTLGDDQPLTILAAGDVQITNVNASGASVTTAGARSDLTVRAGAWLLLGGTSPPRVAASQSSLRVSSWRANVGTNGLSAGLDVELVAGSDVNLYSPYDSLNGYYAGGIVVQAGRDATIRSWLSDVAISGATLLVTGRLTIEAGRNVLVADQAASVSADGGLDMNAPSGRIDVQGGCTVTAGKTGTAGASTWRARDGVFVAGRTSNTFPAGSTYVSSGSAKFVVEATAGDVDLGMDGTSTPPHKIDANGSIELRAAGTVRLRGTSRVTAKTGATLAGQSATSLAAGSSIDAGGGTLVAASPETVSIAGTALGGAVSLWSPKTVSVAAGASVEATTNDLVVTAHDVAFNGTGTARGSVHVFALGGVADVRGATLTTRDATSGASGIVEVVAYPGPNAAVLAQGATLTTGSSATTSGDVVLRVVVPLGAGGPTPGGSTTTPSTTRTDPPFVVPATVVAKARRKSDAQDLTLKGFVDLGAADASVAGPATVSIGDVELATTVVVAKNGSASARTKDVVLTLGRPRAGSPRRTLTFRARGAFLPADLEGELAVRLTLGGVAAACRVRVEGGRFDARRGALVEPALHVEGLKPLKSGYVRLTFGLPTNVVAHAEAPSLVLELAGARWYVERTQLLLKRGRFTAVEPALLLALVSVDPRARTIEFDVAADALALGKDGGPLDVALRVNGGATRLLRAVVGTDRGKLAY